MQLVINTHGAALRREGERFVVQAGGRRVELSAHKVHSILFAAGAVLTTDAVRLAIEHNIDILFLDEYGEPTGRVWSPKLGSVATIRRRQLEAGAGPEGLTLALEWVSAKVRRQEEFLCELLGRRPGSEADNAGALAGLRACRDNLAALTGTLEQRRGTVMGLEGTAGRLYFEALGRLMPADYRFAGRSRQPAKDGFNAALNYCYGVLYGLVERSAVCAGLDPFIGFLHTDNYGKPSLIFDLIEPFRVWAEKTAALLFTGRRAKADWFEAVPGGVALSKDGRSAVLESLNKRLDDTIRYTSQAGRPRNIKRRDVVRYECHALANRLLGKSDFPRVVETATWAAEAIDAPADEDEPTAADEEPTSEAIDEGGEPC